MKTRICSKCAKELPLTAEYFTRNKNFKDGFYFYCRECRNKSRRKTEPLMPSREGFRVCKSCKNEFPATIEYFMSRKGRSLDIGHICKECRNAKYRKTPKLPKAKSGFKICSSCLRELPANYDYFWKNISKKDGLNGICKDCGNERQKGPNSYKQAKPGYRYCRKCDKELPLSVDNFRMINGSFLHICRDCDKPRRNANRQKRRSIKRQLINDYSISDWDTCLEHFDYKCAYCSCVSEELQQEHFVPVVSGGGYTKNNIIPACKRCNSSKNDSDFFEWYPKQEFYSKENEEKILKYLNLYSSD